MSNKQRRKKLRRKKIRRQKRLNGELPDYMHVPGYDRDRPLTEEERARVLSRFSCLRGRGGVTIGFHPLGRTVQASNPEELREAMERALIEETEQQVPT